MFRRLRITIAESSR